MISFVTLLRKRTTPIVIGITGDSGSGKTTYSNGVRRLLGLDIVRTIDMDGYHKENRKEREKTGHLPLDPTINRLDLLYEHLSLLKAGKAVEIPIYNHTTGDFDKPVPFSPSPVIIIEGLHALYPEFLPFYDFSIYVDPSREIKWKWKYERDLEKRGHDAISLREEMLKRESAYKRWIDWQKTSANVVIKILPSTLKELARYEVIGQISPDCYKVELIIEQTSIHLPTLPLPFDLGAIVDAEKPAFMLSAVPSLYWGRKVMVVHIDGEIAKETIAALEDQIVKFTGIPCDEIMHRSPIREKHEEVFATQFAQLLITWRFLEKISHLEL
jgi:phosphoribulokinase